MNKEIEIALTKKELETLEKFIINEMQDEERWSITKIRYRVLKSILHKIAKAL